MKLSVFSDLHLEAFNQGRFLPESTAEVIVLAGDIDVGVKGLEWAAEQFLGKTIIYVPGNHEFYDSSIENVRSGLRERAQQLGINLLDNGTLTLGDVKFFGTTLWTDFDLYKNNLEHDQSLMEEQIYSLIPDFKKIECRRGKSLAISDLKALFAEAIAWLNVELTKPFHGRKVVISHHAPLAACIPRQYKNSPLSPAFASALNQMMGEMDLWIHGHVHEPVDFVCSGTRVFSNPGGYPNEFDPLLFDAEHSIVI